MTAAPIGSSAKIIAGSIHQESIPMSGATAEEYERLYREFADGAGDTWLRAVFVKGLPPREVLRRIDVVPGTAGDFGVEAYAAGRGTVLIDHGGEHGGMASRSLSERSSGSPRHRPADPPRNSGSDGFHPGTSFVGRHREFVPNKPYSFLFMTSNLQLAHASGDLHGSYGIRVLEHAALAQELHQRDHPKNNEADEEEAEYEEDDRTEHSMIVTFGLPEPAVLLRLDTVPAAGTDHVPALIFPVFSARGGKVGGRFKNRRRGSLPVARSERKA